MKTAFCISLLVLFAFAGVHGHRNLLQGSSMAFASAVSTGGNAVAVATGTNGGSSVSMAESSGPDSSATSVSEADGEGAMATTITSASDGATVEGSTDVTSEDGAPVSGTTSVTGEGPGTTSASLTVKSDEPISIGVFLTRIVDDEEDIDVVAREIVVIFGGSTNARIIAALKEGFAGDESSVALFVRVVELFFDGKDCDDDVKPVFEGVERDFIVYPLPGIVSQCIYAPCSDYDSAEFCCGEAQLDQEFCSCADGKCAWAQPDTPNPIVPYWDCLDCGEPVDFCVCA